MRTVFKVIKKQSDGKACPRGEKLSLSKEYVHKKLKNYFT